MRYIDIHPHIISPDRGAYPRAPLGGKSSRWSDEHAVTHEEMVAAMDEAGIERSVLVQAVTCYGYDNSYVADAVAAHPDRLGAVFTIDALADDAPKQLGHWVSRGLSGARLFTTGSTMPGQSTWFADPRVYPFWQEAKALGLPVCIQMSWVGIPQLRTILETFPDVRVILDHLTRPPIDDGPPYRKAQPVFDLAQYPNLYLKITPVNVFAMDEAPASADTFMRRLVDAFGADRIAWGSNYPSTTATLREALEINLRAAARLTEAEQLQIFRETALSLYPRVGKTKSS